MTDDSRRDKEFALLARELDELENTVAAVVWAAEARAARAEARAAMVEATSNPPDVQTLRELLAKARVYVERCRGDGDELLMRIEAALAITDPALVPVARRSRARRRIPGSPLTETHHDANQSQ